MWCNNLRILKWTFNSINFILWSKYWPFSALIAISEAQADVYFLFINSTNNDATVSALTAANCTVLMRWLPVGLIILTILTVTAIRAAYTMAGTSYLSKSTEDQSSYWLKWQWEKGLLWYSCNLGPELRISRFLKLCFEISSSV